MPEIRTVIHKQGTAAAWSAANPLLLLGQLGYETDTGRWKVGDGNTAWTALPYSLDRVQVGPRIFLVENDDGFWLTGNARWDGAHWQRIDVAKWACGLNIRTAQNLPFEAATGGVVFWKCPPGANPINPVYATVDGWQNGFLMTEFGDLVIGGFGIELDGSGTVPYGRLLHYSNAGASPHLTGILSNLFLDLANSDDHAKPSWFVGRKDDAVVVARAAAGAFGAASLATLLEITAAGHLVGKSQDVVATQPAAAIAGDAVFVTGIGTSPGGVILPTAKAGMRITVHNHSGEGINIFPATGAAIIPNAANAAAFCGDNYAMVLTARSATQWYRTAYSAWV